MSMLQWPAWGTVVSLQVTEASALRAAHRLVNAALARSESVADLRNPAAEVHRLDGAAGRPVRVSAMLAGLVDNCLQASRLTGGLLDPTVGAAVVRQEAIRSGAGGRKDLSLLPVCGGLGLPGPRGVPRPAPGWQSIRLDGRTLTMPAGTLLDLTAITKAVTAAYCATLVRQRLGIGVLIDLGGDLVTAGPAPAGGWWVEEIAGTPERLPSGAARATVHRPIIDPLTGGMVNPVAGPVTVRADGLPGGLLEAKALAVAAVLSAGRAPGRPASSPRPVLPASA